MKIIVTGGAGFIGSHLADRLIHEGHRVVILDDFSAGSKKFVNPKAKVVKTSTHDYKKTEAVFKSFCPETVFHLAAQIELRSTFADKKRYATDSMNIWRLAQEYGVKKLIFASSAAVYGLSESVPLHERHLVNPVSGYGHAKVNFELHLASQYRNDKMRVVILRYSNVYGPRQGTVGEGGVVAIFCKQLLAGKPFTIFGSGKQTRDFIYVDDVVRANLAALKSKKKITVYNVSTNQETSVNELASKLLSISGGRAKVKHLRPVRGEVSRSALDNRLIKRELSWSPKVSLSEGLKRTWEWFKENI